jgi:GTP cyclohydrolase II
MSQHIENYPSVAVPTPSATLRAKVVDVNGQVLLVATSSTIPAVPVVRFHSSCLFGEAFHAVDCDCGAQLVAAISMIGQEGGILIYAWEEGRGVGIVDKLRAIALQQSKGLSTAEAFAALGYIGDPRTFEAHIAALKTVYDGNRIKFASDNPRKIDALRSAGYIVERVKLNVAMTPERKRYLLDKQHHLGHLDDD